MQDRILGRLLVVTIAIQLIFAIWPGIDLAVSRAFLQPDGTFLLSKSTLAEDVRVPIWLASVFLAVLAMVMFGVSLCRGVAARSSWRLWGFVSCLYILGPGLLVNALLKQNWGRARPDTVEAFGGTKLFTPPFEIAGQCAKNCSFVSGEAASAAVMVIVLAILFAGRVSKPRRDVMFVGLAALFVLASGMRVATGRHFLSDVIFAGLFMLLIARFLYRTFGVTAAQTEGLLSAIRDDIQGVIRPLGQIVGRLFAPSKPAKEVAPDVSDAIIDPVSPKA